MLSAEERRRLTVVLVGARNPQNIGAAARAMHDFGFSELRVVNAYAPPFEAAQLEASSAVAAGEVMRAAQLFSGLKEALADCTLVVGTTAIGGRNLERAVMPLKDVAPVILREMRSKGSPDAAADDDPSVDDGRRVALLFGSEKTGLTNEQLSYCSHLLTIPMFAPEGRHLSMNLGQSVAVCLYELTREGLVDGREMTVPVHAPATADDRERLVGLVLEAMQQSGYAQRFPANARSPVVRSLVNQLGQSREEAATWMGFLRVVLRKLGVAGSSGSLPAELEGK